MARSSSFSKTSPRFRFPLLAAVAWLSASPAFAQEQQRDIVLGLTPAEVAEITRLVDMQPISQAPPPEFWDLQIKIGKALDANPETLRALISARRAAR